MLAIRSISAEQVLAANGNLTEGFVVIRLERCSVIGDELHLDAGKRQSDVSRGDDRRMLLSSNSSRFRSGRSVRRSVGRSDVRCAQRLQYSTQHAQSDISSGESTPRNG
jgi:hypothetical protein